MTIQNLYHGRIAIAAIFISTLGGCASSLLEGRAAAMSPTAMQANLPASESDLSMEQIIGMAEELGYSDISEIEREGERYCVEALDPDGKRVEVFFDAATGQVIPDIQIHGSPRSDRLSIKQIILQARTLGYSDITEVEREDDRYCVKARDAEGKEVEIYLNAKTGEPIAEDQPNKNDTQDGSELTKSAVTAMLESAGYPEVAKIEREGEGDNYWVLANDVNGDVFELHVNAITGAITRKEKRGQ